MKSKITNIEFYNYSRNNTLIGLLREGRYISILGEIVDISNLGNMNFNIHWEENLDGESRTFTASQIKSQTYTITVMDETYDASSRIGDNVYIKIKKDGIYYYLWGILGKITRDRFEVSNNVKYQTAYEVYSSNPLWRLGQTTPPKEYEPDEMTNIHEGIIDLSNPEAETIAIDKTWLNTVRGFKLSLFLQGTETGELPTGKKIAISFNGLDIVLTFPTAYYGFNEEIYFIVGQSLFMTNTNATDDGKYISDLSLKKKDLTPYFIEPPQWDNKTVTFSASGTVGDYMLRYEIDMIEGVYF